MPGWRPNAPRTQQPTKRRSTCGPLSIYLCRVHKLSEPVVGTNGKSGSWCVIHERDGSIIGQVDVLYLQDGRRTVCYVDKAKGTDETVALPVTDVRDDQRVATDTVFTGKAGGNGTFRPAT